MDSVNYRLAELAYLKVRSNDRKCCDEKMPKRNIYIHRGKILELCARCDTIIRNKLFDIDVEHIKLKPIITQLDRLENKLGILIKSQKRKVFTTDQLNAIILAYLCDDESHKYFNDQIHQIFGQMYFPDKEVDFDSWLDVRSATSMLTIFDTCIDISYGEVSYRYDYETKQIRVSDDREHSIYIYYDENGVCINATHGNRKIAVPTQNEYLKLPIYLIHQFDSTGKFGLFALFKNIISKDDPNQVLNWYDYIKYADRNCVET